MSWKLLYPAAPKRVNSYFLEHYHQLIWIVPVFLPFPVHFPFSTTQEAPADHFQGWVDGSQIYRQSGAGYFKPAFEFTKHQSNRLWRKNTFMMYTEKQTTQHATIKQTKQSKFLENMLRPRVPGFIRFISVINRALISFSAPPWSAFPVQGDHQHFHRCIWRNHLCTDSWNNNRYHFDVPLSLSTWQPARVSCPAWPPPSSG